jgi:riboflavin biosynthesis pyrimidine reductase
VTGDHPHRVVLDSRLRTPKNAQLLERVGEERVVIFSRHDHGSPEALEALRARGAEVILLENTASGLVDIAKALFWLRHNGVRSLLVEGGARTIESFLSAGMVDRMSVEVAPWFLGKNGLPALGAFPRAFRLDRVTVEPLGSHVLVSGVPVLS